MAIVAFGRWPGPKLLHKFQVWHHERRLRLAMAEFREHLIPAPTIIDRVTAILRINRPPVWERENIHKERLVELGGLEFHEFRLMNFVTGTGASREGRHFLRSLFGREAPPCVDWSSDHPRWPQQLVLNVWCKPGGIAAWRAFVRKYDVPHYWEIRDQSVTLEEPVENHSEPALQDLL
ncbi:MAG TPA: hypothetical protein VM510_12900 [Caulifigura sp.]|nr:hypothetical protein [Caulifigura sp.]